MQVIAYSATCMCGAILVHMNNTLAPNVDYCESCGYYFDYCKCEVGE